MKIRNFQKHPLRTASVVLLVVVVLVGGIPGVFFSTWTATMLSSQGVSSKLVDRIWPAYIPDVLGDPLTNARSAIKAAHLRTGKTHYLYMLEGLPLRSKAPSNLKANAVGITPGKGGVFGEFPAPGSRVSRGTKVDLIVSKGPPLVPSVVGEKLSWAEEDLASAGMVNGTISYHETCFQNPGFVVAQPSQNQYRPPGTRIDLEVTRLPQWCPNLLTKSQINNIEIGAYENYSHQYQQQQAIQQQQAANMPPP